MGVDLAKQLFARHAADLTAGELTVLGYMCLVALDKPNGRNQPPGLYFGGWEPLALALGYDGLTEAAKTKVKRAVRGVREKGLVKPMVAHAQTGERQVYRITFANTGGQNQTPNRGSEVDPQEGVRSRPDRGSESDPPRTELGQTEDLPQDISISSVTGVQTARGDDKRNEEVVPHKFRGQPGDDCGTCGGSHINRRLHPLHLLRSETA